MCYLPRQSTRILIYDLLVSLHFIFVYALLWDLPMLSEAVSKYWVVVQNGIIWPTLAWVDDFRYTGRQSSVHGKSLLSCKHYNVVNYVNSFEYILSDVLEFAKSSTFRSKYVKSSYFLLRICVEFCKPWLYSKK